MVPANFIRISSFLIVPDCPSCTWCFRHISFETAIFIASNLKKKLFFGWVVVYQPTLHLPCICSLSVDECYHNHTHIIHTFHWHALLLHTHMYNTDMQILYILGDGQVNMYGNMGPGNRKNIDEKSYDPIQ